MYSFALKINIFKHVFLLIFQVFWMTFFGTSNWTPYQAILYCVNR